LNDPPLIVMVNDNTHMWTALKRAINDQGCRLDVIDSYEENTARGVILREASQSGGSI
jgi:ActR/RegA family two-component response regulator